MDRPAFLRTYRAQAVAGREFNRFSEALVAGAQRAATQSGSEAPTTRLSPDRCIVQFGPVALTVTYIRTGNDVPAGGQLLAILWHGTIAPRGEHVPERRAIRQAAPPVQLWEETHVVSADDETTWHWHPQSVEQRGFTSPELAGQCIERLQAALTKTLS